MNTLIDEKSRCLLSALRTQYVNALQLEGYLAQYKSLRGALETEKNDISNELLRNVNACVEENRCISIPVATYVSIFSPNINGDNTDILPVTVKFLDGKSAFMLCPNFYKLSDVRPLLAKHASTFDPKDMLLGFSHDCDGEVVFLDENVPLEKLIGKTKSLDTTLLVKFYIPDVSLLDNVLSRHQLYLQLRRDLSGSDRLFLTSQDRISAAAFAVLAEDVDRGCLSVDSNKLSGLVGWRVVEQYGSAKADSLLRTEVAKLDQDLPKSVAELEFCKIVQNNENYGKRYYRIYAHKDFEVQLSSLYVSLSVFGITIEEASPTISADLPPTVVLHSFSWRQIARFSFAWHRLTIGIKQAQSALQQDSKSKSNNCVLHYYVRKKSVGNYLLQLAADLNQFQMSLLQTYRIDRIIFPRSATGPFDTCRSATMPRHDVEVMAMEHFSSTMPRKHCANGLSQSFENELTSPIFAFGHDGCSGRASAPPASTNNLLISSMMNLEEQPARVQQNQPPERKQQLLSQLKSDSRIGMFRTQPNSKWMSLSDFRHSNKNNENPEMSLANYVKTVLSNDVMAVEQARVVPPKENEQNEEVAYDFAASLVPAEKAVQGMPLQDVNSDLFQVVLQRDAVGSIGFSLTLDPSTRHLVVKKMRSGGAAERSGQITIGDRLVKIGDYNLTGKDYEDCVSLLRSISFPVKLTFERPKQGVVADSIGSAGSSLDEFDQQQQGEDDGTEAFDTLSYPHDEIVPEELMLQPSYPVDHQVFDQATITPYHHQAPHVVQTELGDAMEAGFLTKNAIEQIEFEQNKNNVSEDVVHEEMSYPSGSDFSVSDPRAYTDEVNPYAYTNEDIDERLIEKMLNTLGEDVVEEQQPVNNEPTFQLNLTRLDDDQGFGFSVLFSNGRCTVTRVEQQQAESSGLATGDVIVAVNGEPVDECTFADFVESSDSLQLTLLACVDIKTQFRQSEPVCYDFRLPANNIGLPHQQSQQAASEIITVSVTKQPCEELGCSLFACGSEIFIGTVKPGSKLAACGVQSGDMCLLVNNESVFGMPSEKVASALRSAAGQVTLTLSRRKSSSQIEEPHVFTAVESDGLLAHFSEVTINLGKQLSPAMRADLRRLAALWHRLDIDDHDREFTQITSRLGPVESAVTRPSTCQDLDAVLLELSSCTFVIANVPTQQSFGYFWQLVSDCNIQVMVMLGNLPHAFFPLQCDEVLKVNLPTASHLSVSVRLQSSSSEIDNLTVSKFALSKSKQERMFYLIQCVQLPEVFCPSLVDALILPHALVNNSDDDSSSPILVCSDFSSSSFDQRGVYCVVSSILSMLFVSSSSPSSIITASSVADSAAQLRRQHPDSLRCVEQLTCIYDTAASSIDRLVAEDALSY